MDLAPNALLWSGSAALAAPDAGALGWSATTAAMPAPKYAGHAAGSELRWAWPATRSRQARECAQGSTCPRRQQICIAGLKTCARFDCDTASRRRPAAFAARGPLLMREASHKPPHCPARGARAAGRQRGQLRHLLGADATSKTRGDCSARSAAAKLVVVAELRTERIFGASPKLGGRVGLARRHFSEVLPGQPWPATTPPRCSARSSSTSRMPTSAGTSSCRPRRLRTRRAVRRLPALALCADVRPAGALRWVPSPRKAARRTGRDVLRVGLLCWGRLGLLETGKVHMREIGPGRHFAPQIFTPPLWLFPSPPEPLPSVRSRAH